MSERTILLSEGGTGLREHTSPMSDPMRCTNDRVIARAKRTRP